MDERPYKGIWYRVLETGGGRWRFAVMEDRHGRPVHSGTVEGDENAAIDAAKIWIDLLCRPSG